MRFSFYFIEREYLKPQVKDSENQPQNKIISMIFLGNDMGDELIELKRPALGSTYICVLSPLGEDRGEALLSAVLLHRGYTCRLQKC